MLYKPQNFILPNRLFPRFLFSDIFIIDNNIGLISIVYPDENIDFNKIECIINNQTYYFSKQIINRVYESNVFLCTESQVLSKFINGKSNLKIKIKYYDLENEFVLNPIKIKRDQIVFSTLFKDDFYLLNMWIDYNYNLGIDFFILYYNKEFDTRVLELMNTPKYKDKVLLIEWNYVHKLPEILGKDSRVNILDKSLQKNHHHAQPMSMCHCLNYIGSKSKWLGFFDLDEYIIMHNETNIKDVLNKYSTNDIAAIKFQCRWAKLQNWSPNENPNNGVNILTKYNSFRKIETEGTFFRTKVILKPNLVERCNVHRLKRHAPNTKEILLNTDSYYFLHYFNINCGWGGRDKRDPFKDKPKIILDNRLIELVKYNNIKDN